MRVQVGKTFKFEAAHKLPYHQGQCRNLHGHSYKVEIVAVGEVQGVHPTNSESGMVIDFQALSDVWKAHLSPILDHGPTTLNELLDPIHQAMYPTAEHLAIFILEMFRLYSPVEIVSVKLWETETSYALVS